MDGGVNVPSPSLAVPSKLAAFSTSDLSCASRSIRRLAIGSASHSSPDSSDACSSRNRNAERVSIGKDSVVGGEREGIRTSSPCSRRKRSSSSFSAIFCLTLFFLRGGSGAAGLAASGSESSSSQSSYSRSPLIPMEKSESSVSVPYSVAHAKRGSTHLDLILHVLVVKLLSPGRRQFRRRSDLLWLVVVFCSSPSQNESAQGRDCTCCWKHCSPQSLMLCVCVYRVGVCDGGTMRRREDLRRIVYLQLRAEKSSKLGAETHALTREKKGTLAGSRAHLRQKSAILFCSTGHALATGPVI